MGALVFLDYNMMNYKMVKINQDRSNKIKIPILKISFKHFLRLNVTGEKVEAQISGTH